MAAVVPTDKPVPTLPLPGKSPRKDAPLRTPRVTDDSDDETELVDPMAMFAVDEVALEEDTSAVHLSVHPWSQLEGRSVWRVRLARICILLAALAVSVGIIPAARELESLLGVSIFHDVRVPVSGQFDLSAEAPLEVELGGCDLELVRGTSQLGAVIYTRLGYDAAGVRGQLVRAAVPSDAGSLLGAHHVRCRVELRVPPDAPLPALSVRALDGRHVDVSSALGALEADAFFVEGARVDVQLGELRVGAVNVTVARGSIAVDNFALLPVVAGANATQLCSTSTSTSTSTCEWSDTAVMATEAGDVVANLNQSTVVSFVSPRQVYCFSGPNVTLSTLYCDDEAPLYHLNLTVATSDAAGGNDTLAGDFRVAMGDVWSAPIAHDADVQAFLDALRPVLYRFDAALQIWGFAHAYRWGPDASGGYTWDVGVDSALPWGDLEFQFAATALNVSSAATAVEVSTASSTLVGEYEPSAAHTAYMDSLTVRTTEAGEACFFPFVYDRVVVDGNASWTEELVLFDCTDLDVDNATHTWCSTGPELAPAVCAEFDANATLVDERVCQGIAVVCVGEATCDAAALPTLSVTLDDGGVYGRANALPEDDNNNATLAAAAADMVAASDAFADGPGLDELSADVLALFQRSVEGSAGADVYYMIDIDSPGADFGSFAFTTSPAFVTLSPTWFSVFSMGLLNPVKERYSARMVPGFCPADAAAIGSVWQALNDTIGTTATQRLALLSFDGTFLVDINAEDGSYAFSELSFWSSGALLLAVAFSLTLALLSAVLGVGVWFYILGRMNRHADAILRSQRHVLNYKRKEVGARVANHDRVVTVRMQGVFWNSTVGNFPVAQLEDSPRTGITHVFGILEMAVSMFRLNLENSLSRFLTSLDSVQLEKETDDPHARTHIKEFKRVYEQFTTKHGMRTMSVRNNEAVLQAFGLSVIKVADESTNAFLKVRWKTLKELTDTEELDESEIADMNTVDYFLYCQCVATGMDYDYILVGEFKRLYDKFCDNKSITGLDKDPLTADHAQVVAFGGEFQREREELFVHGVVLASTLAAVPAAAASRLQRYTAARVRETYRFSCSLVRTRPMALAGRARAVFFARALFALMFKPGTVFGELLVALTHFGFVLFVPVLLVLPALSHELQRGALALRPESELSASDIFQPTWGDSGELFWLVDKPLQPYIAAICAITAFFYAFSALQLLSFYCTAGIPHPDHPVVLTRAAYALYRLYYGMLGFFVCASVGYIALAMVWAILAAVLNPNAFLPYCVAVATLLAFAATQLHRLKTAHKTFKKKIQTAVQKKFNRCAKNRMIGNIADQKAPGNLMEAAVEGSGLNQLMAAAGVSLPPEVITQLAKGDTSGLVDFVAQEKGMHPTIVAGIVAVARRDRDELRAVAVQLAQMFGLDPKLAEVLCELMTAATADEEEEAEAAAADAAAAAVTDAAADAAAAAGSKPGNNMRFVKDVFRKVFPGLNPQFISLLYSLLALDTEQLVAATKSMGSDLIEGALRDPQASQRLFVKAFGVPAPLVRLVTAAARRDDKELRAAVADVAQAVGLPEALCEAGAAMLLDPECDRRVAVKELVLDTFGRDLDPALVEAVDALVAAGDPVPLFEFVDADEALLNVCTDLLPLLSRAAELRDGSPARVAALVVGAFGLPVSAAVVEAALLLCAKDDEQLAPLAVQHLAPLAADFLFPEDKEQDAAQKLAVASVVVDAMVSRRTDKAKHVAAGVLGQLPGLSFQGDDADATARYLLEYISSDCDPEVRAPELVRRVAAHKVNLDDFILGLPASTFTREAAEAHCAQRPSPEQHLYRWLGWELVCVVAAFAAGDARAGLDLVAEQLRAWAPVNQRLFGQPGLWANTAMGSAVAVKAALRMLRSHCSLPLDEQTCNVLVDLVVSRDAAPLAEFARQVGAAHVVSQLGPATGAAAALHEHTDLLTAVLHTALGNPSSLRATVRDATLAQLRRALRQHREFLIERLGRDYHMPPYLVHGVLGALLGDEALMLSAAGDAAAAAGLDSARFQRVPALLMDVRRGLPELVKLTTPAEAHPAVDALFQYAAGDRAALARLTGLAAVESLHGTLSHAMALMAGDSRRLLPLLATLPFGPRVHPAALRAALFLGGDHSADLADDLAAAVPAPAAVARPVVAVALASDPEEQKDLLVAGLAELLADDEAEAQVLGAFLQAARGNAVLLVEYEAEHRMASTTDAEFISKLVHGGFVRGVANVVGANERDMMLAFLDKFDMTEDCVRSVFALYVHDMPALRAEISARLAAKFGVEAPLADALAALMVARFGDSKDEVVTCAVALARLAGARGSDVALGAVARLLLHLNPSPLRNLVRQVGVMGVFEGLGVEVRAQASSGDAAVVALLGAVLAFVTAPGRLRASAAAIAGGEDVELARLQRAVQAVGVHLVSIVLGNNAELAAAVGIPGALVRCVVAAAHKSASEMRDALLPVLGVSPQSPLATLAGLMCEFFLAGFHTDEEEIQPELDSIITATATVSLADRLRGKASKAREAVDSSSKAATLFGRARSSKPAAETPGAPAKPGQPRRASVWTLPRTERNATQLLQHVVEMAVQSSGAALDSRLLEGVVHFAMAPRVADFDVAAVPASAHVRAVLGALRIDASLCAAGRRNVFLLNKATGAVQVVKLGADGEPKPVAPAGDRWAPGFTHLEPLLLDDQPFLLAYKLKSGRFELRSLAVDGTTAAVRDGEWATGFNGVVAAGGGGHVVLVSGATGEVLVKRSPALETVCEAQWDPGFSVVTRVHGAGVLAVAPSSGQWLLHDVNPASGALVLRSQGHFRAGVASAVSFAWRGLPALALYMRGSGVIELLVYEPKTSRFSPRNTVMWTMGFTGLCAYAVSGQAYLLLFKEGTGAFETVHVTEDANLELVRSGRLEQSGWSAGMTFEFPEYAGPSKLGAVVRIREQVLSGVAPQAAVQHSVEGVRVALERRLGLPAEINALLCAVATRNQPLIVRALTQVLLTQIGAHADTARPTAEIMVALIFSSEVYEQDAAVLVRAALQRVFPEFDGARLDIVRSLARLELAPLFSLTRTLGVDALCAAVASGEGSAASIGINADVMRLALVMGEVQTTPTAASSSPREAAELEAVADTPHPLAKAAKQGYQWAVQVPGAPAQVLVSLDPRSACTSAGAVLSISAPGQDKVQIALGAANRQLPGVGGVPPLLLESAALAVELTGLAAGEEGWGVRVLAQPALAASESPDAQQRKVDAMVSALATPMGLDRRVAQAAFRLALLAAGTAGSQAEKTQIVVPAALHLAGVLCPAAPAGLLRGLLHVSAGDSTHVLSFVAQQLAAFASQRLRAALPPALVTPELAPLSTALALALSRGDREALGRAVGHYALGAVLRSCSPPLSRAQLEAAMAFVRAPRSSAAAAAAGKRLARALFPGASAGAVDLAETVFRVAQGDSTPLLDIQRRFASVVALLEVVDAILRKKTPKQVLLRIVGDLLPPRKSVRLRLRDIVSGLMDVATGSVQGVNTLAPHLGLDKYKRLPVVVHQGLVAMQNGDLASLRIVLNQLGHVLGLPHGGRDLIVLLNAVHGSTFDVSRDARVCGAHGKVAAAMLALGQGDTGALAVVTEALEATGEQQKKLEMVVAFVLGITGTAWESEAWGAPQQFSARLFDGSAPGQRRLLADALGFDNSGRLVALMNAVLCSGALLNAPPEGWSLLPFEQPGAPGKVCACAVCARRTLAGVEGLLRVLHRAEGAGAGAGAATWRAKRVIARGAQSGQLLVSDVETGRTEWAAPGSLVCDYGPSHEAVAAFVAGPADPSRFLVATDASLTTFAEFTGAPLADVPRARVHTIVRRKRPFSLLRMPAVRAWVDAVSEVCGLGGGDGRLQLRSADEASARLLLHGAAAEADLAAFEAGNHEQARALLQHGGEGQAQVQAQALTQNRRAASLRRRCWHARSVAAAQRAFELLAAFCESPLELGVVKCLVSLARGSSSKAEMQLLAGALAPVTPVQLGLVVDLCSGDVAAIFQVSDPAYQGSGTAPLTTVDALKESSVFITAQWMAQHCRNADRNTVLSELLGINRAQLSKFSARILESARVVALGRSLTLAQLAAKLHLPEWFLLCLTGTTAAGDVVAAMVADVGLSGLRQFNARYAGRMAADRASVERAAPVLVALATGDWRAIEPQLAALAPLVHELLFHDGATVPRAALPAFLNAVTELLSGRVSNPVAIVDQLVRASGVPPETAAVLQFLVGTLILRLRGDEWVRSPGLREVFPVAWAALLGREPTPAEVWMVRGLVAFATGDREQAQAAACAICGLSQADAMAVYSLGQGLGSDVPTAPLEAACRKLRLDAPLVLAFMALLGDDVAVVDRISYLSHAFRLDQASSGVFLGVFACFKRDTTSFRPLAAALGVPVEVLTAIVTVITGRDDLFDAHLRDVVHLLDEGRDAIGARAAHDLVRLVRGEPAAIAALRALPATASFSVDRADLLSALVSLVLPGSAARDKFSAAGLLARVVDDALFGDAEQDRRRERRNAIAAVVAAAAGLPGAADALVDALGPAADRVRLPPDGRPLAEVENRAEALAAALASMAVANSPGALRAAAEERLRNKRRAVGAVSGQSDGSDGEGDTETETDSSSDDDDDDADGNPEAQGQAEGMASLRAAEARESSLDNKLALFLGRQLGIVPADLSTDDTVEAVLALVQLGSGHPDPTFVRDVLYAASPAEVDTVMAVLALALGDLNLIALFERNVVGLAHAIGIPDGAVALAAARRLALLVHGDAGLQRCRQRHRHTFAHLACAAQHERLLAALLGQAEGSRCVAAVRTLHRLATASPAAQRAAVAAPWVPRTAVQTDVTALLRLLLPKERWSKTAYALLQLATGELSEEGFMALLGTLPSLPRGRPAVLLWGVLTMAHPRRPLRRADAEVVLEALRLEEHEGVALRLLACARGDVAQFERLCADAAAPVLAKLSRKQAKVAAAETELHAVLRVVRGIACGHFDAMDAAVRALAELPGGPLSRVDARTRERFALLATGDSGLLSFIMHRDRPSFWVRVLQETAAGELTFMRALGLAPQAHRVLLALGMRSRELVGKFCTPEALAPMLRVLAEQRGYDGHGLYFDARLVHHVMQAAIGDTGAVAEVALYVASATGKAGLAPSPKLLLSLAHGTDLLVAEERERFDRLMRGEVVEAADAGRLIWDEAAMAALAPSPSPGKGEAAEAEEDEDEDEEGEGEGEGEGGRGDLPPPPPSEHAMSGLHTAAIEDWRMVWQFESMGDGLLTVWRPVTSHYVLGDHVTVETTEPPTGAWTVVREEFDGAAEDDGQDEDEDEDEEEEEEAEEQDGPPKPPKNRRRALHAAPVGFKPLWRSKEVVVWEMVPPPCYVALGHVWTRRGEDPDPADFACIAAGRCHPLPPPAVEARAWIGAPVEGTDDDEAGPAADGCGALSVWSTPAGAHCAVTAGAWPASRLRYAPARQAWAGLRALWSGAVEAAAGVQAQEAAIVTAAQQVSASRAPFLQNARDSAAEAAPEEPLPLAWEPARQSDLQLSREHCAPVIELSEDGLEAFVDPNADMPEGDVFAAVQTGRPVDRNAVVYVEATIVNKSPAGCVGFGFASLLAVDGRRGPTVSESLAQWSAPDSGFHQALHKSAESPMRFHDQISNFYGFVADARLARRERLAAPQHKQRCTPRSSAMCFGSAGKGSVVGLGYDPVEQSMFITIDGELERVVFPQARRDVSKGGWRPTVVMQARRDRVRLRVAGDFAYDLSAHAANVVAHHHARSFAAGLKRAQIFRAVDVSEAYRRDAELAWLRARRARERALVQFVQRQSQFAAQLSRDAAAIAAEERASAQMLLRSPRDPHHHHAEDEGAEDSRGRLRAIQQLAFRRKRTAAQRAANDALLAAVTGADGSVEALRAAVAQLQRELEATEAHAARLAGRLEALGKPLSSNAAQRELLLWKQSLLSLGYGGARDLRQLLLRLTQADGAVSEAVQLFDRADELVAGLYRHLGSASAAAEPTADAWPYAAGAFRGGDTSALDGLRLSIVAASVLSLAYSPPLRSPRPFHALRVQTGDAATEVALKRAKGAWAQPRSSDASLLPYHARALQEATVMFYADDGSVCAAAAYGRDKCAAESALGVRRLWSHSVPLAPGRERDQESGLSVGAPLFGRLDGELTPLLLLMRPRTGEWVLRRATPGAASAGSVSQTPAGRRPLADAAGQPYWDDWATGRVDLGAAVRHAVFLPALDRVLLLGEGEGAAWLLRLERGLRWASVERCSGAVPGAGAAVVAFADRYRAERSAQQLLLSVERASGAWTVLAVSAAGALSAVGSGEGLRANADVHLFLSSAGQPHALLHTRESGEWESRPLLGSEGELLLDSVTGSGQLPTHRRLVGLDLGGRAHWLSLPSRQPKRKDSSRHMSQLMATRDDGQSLSVVYTEKEGAALKYHRMAWALPLAAPALWLPGSAVVETAHPCQGGRSAALPACAVTCPRDSRKRYVVGGVRERVFFPGAQELVVSFDPRSRTLSERGASDALVLRSDAGGVLETMAGDEFHELTVAGDNVTLSFKPGCRAKQLWGFRAVVTPRYAHIISGLEPGREVAVLAGPAVAGGQLAAPSPARLAPTESAPPGEPASVQAIVLQSTRVKVVFTEPGDPGDGPVTHYEVAWTGSDSGTARVEVGGDDGGVVARIDSPWHPMQLPSDTSDSSGNGEDSSGDGQEGEGEEGEDGEGEEKEEDEERKEEVDGEPSEEQDEEDMGAEEPEQDAEDGDGEGKDGGDEGPDGRRLVLQRVVSIPGVRALRVQFDPRSSTGDCATLEFEWEESGQLRVAQFSGGPESFTPFIIPSRRFRYRLWDRRKSPAQRASGWGWRFVLTSALVCELPDVGMDRTLSVSVRAANAFGRGPARAARGAVTTGDLVRRSVSALGEQALDGTIDALRRTREQLRTKADLQQELNKLFAWTGLPRGSPALTLLHGLFSKEFDVQRLEQMLAHGASFQSVFILGEEEWRPIVLDFLAAVAREDYSFTRSQAFLAKALRTVDFDLQATLCNVMGLLQRKPQAFEWLLRQAPAGTPAVIPTLLRAMVAGDMGTLVSELPRMAVLLSPHLGLPPDRLLAYVDGIVLWIQGVRQLVRKGRGALKDPETLTSLERMVGTVVRLGLLRLEVPQEKVNAGLKGVLAMASADMAAFSEVAGTLGVFDAAAAQNLIAIVEKYCGAAPADDAAADEVDLPSNADLFSTFDKDKSGYLLFPEFVSVTKYIGVPLSEEKVKVIFSKTSGGDEEMDEEEFQDAMALVQETVAEGALSHVGMTPAKLAGAFLFSLTFLGVLFAFIFMGISAFTTGSTFGSVVNSLLPMSAGGAMSSSSSSGDASEGGGEDGEGSDGEDESVTAAAVDSTLSDMSPDS